MSLVSSISLHGDPSAPWRTALPPLERMPLCDKKSLQKVPYADLTSLPSRTYRHAARPYIAR